MSGAELAPTVSRCTCCPVQWSSAEFQKEQSLDILRTAFEQQGNTLVLSG